MSLSKSQRAAVREMFGGCCAYCGHPLGEKWHADHVEAVRRDSDYVPGGFTNGTYRPARLVSNGKMLRPENDRLDNYFPACVPCNIDKSCEQLESWRKSLERKIGVALRGSTPLRHAHRFGLVQFSDVPIVFHFEKYLAASLKQEPR